MLRHRNGVEAENDANTANAAYETQLTDLQRDAHRAEMAKDTQNIATFLSETDCQDIVGTIVSAWRQYGTPGKKIVLGNERGLKDLSAMTVYDFINSRVQAGKVIFHVYDVQTGERRAMDVNFPDYDVMVFYFRYIRPKWATAFRRKEKKAKPVETIKHPHFGDLTTPFLLSSTGCRAQ